MWYGMGRTSALLDRAASSHTASAAWSCVSPKETGRLEFPEHHVGGEVFPVPDDFAKALAMWKDGFPLCKASSTAWYNVE
eukprot:701488-Heterocapsa_arctica.AAC.1